MTSEAPKLRDILELNYGFPLTSEDRIMGNFPVYGSNGITDYHNESKVKGPGIIIGRKGNPGTINWSDSDFFPIDTTFYVEMKNSSIPLFYAYLALKQMNLPWFAADSAVPGINRKTVLNLPFEFDVSEEHMYLNIKNGTTINNLIKNVEKKEKVIKEMVRALFRSWFIDFDPVKAKVEGKLPFGMDEETAALFPDSFENSENGELPKGWSWGTLLDISKIWTGGTPKTSESSYWGGDIPWVSGADLSSNDLFAFDSARKVTSLGVEKSSTKILPVGTVMITARGTVGATKITAVPMAMSQTSFGFKAKKGISDALVYLASQETIRQLHSFAYGAVFDTFTQSTIDITKIAIAPMEVLQAFGKIVDPLFETMKNSAKEIIELSSTRDALLPRLMSGELTIPEVI